jgi:ABC-type transport system involved in cytochrome c biogenesis permease subunit
MIFGAAKRQRRRGTSVSNSESENKQRDRKIANNEANREAVSAVRVSSWAIGVAVIVGVIVFGIVWAWMRR